jgi:hypothetical protein
MLLSGYELAVTTKASVEGFTHLISTFIVTRYRFTHETLAVTVIFDEAEVNELTGLVFLAVL